MSEVAGGRDTSGIAAGLLGGELTALYLLDVDPFVDLPDRAGWEAALEHATTVIAHAAFLSDGLREHASVVFPAEAYPEKEGTVTHPDGRLQRLRPAIARQGEVRATWSILAELCKSLGTDTGIATAVAASAALFDAVPMYAGLTLEEIAGRGVRWPERDQAAALPAPASAPSPAPARATTAAAERRLLLSSYRSLWSVPEVAASPALAFLHPRQRVEISPADARSLGFAEGDHVVAVDSDGASVAAVVAVRDAVPAGRAIMLAGLADDGANALRGELVELREPPPTPPEPAEDAADEEIEEALV